MKKRCSLLASLIVSCTYFMGCSNDESGQIPNGEEPVPCENSSVCKDNEECVEGFCAEKSTEPEENLCGTTKCKPTEKCVAKTCVPIPNCGEYVCSEDETCIDETCVANADLCGGRLCSGDEKCVNDECVNIAECGGKICDINEVCIENRCLEACEESYCEEDYICYLGECVHKGDCGGIECSETQYCLNDFCFPKTLCGESYCEGDEICAEDQTCQKADFCIVESRQTERCGDNCCSAEEFCGNRKECCPNANPCGNDCCQNGEICENEQCHTNCGETDRCELVNGSEVCCAADEICVSNQCFKPTDTKCVDNYMCENGQFCDAATSTCLPQPAGTACMANPTGGEVQPTLLWYWGENPPDPYPNYAQVMSSPMVADINNDTIPEVAFNSYLTGDNWEGNAYLRVLNGKTGELLATSDGSPMTDGGSMVAIGNLDDDPYLEIVTCAADYHLVAYKFIPGDPNTNTKAQLKVMWHHPEHPFLECGQSGPGIADFDGDGKPEVYARYTIHNGLTGDVIARDICEDQSHTHIPCDYSVALDIDDDKKLELVGGNVVYKVDIANKTMTPLWKRTDQIDGYPAVADIDLDKDHKPELVVVRNREATLMAFDARTGENFWQAPVKYSIGGGGTPTIANVNDTPEPEIAFAGAKGNIVLDHNGQELWARGSHDQSSGKTGSTVFDFDGDGKAEIVYADEYFLRVYDGITSKTLFCQCNTTCTHYEYPVIADVNADGHAEILISANTSCNINSCNIQLTPELGKDECVDAIIAKGGDAVKGTQGVRAFASPNRDWVNTRKIYNQHAYNVTNISDNDSLPTTPRNNWTTQNLNNFRLNVQPGANYLPDLEIANLSSPRDCPNPTPVYFSVKNVGWAVAPAGIEIKIWYIDNDGETKLAGSVKTTKDIRPGSYESLQYPFAAADAPNSPSLILTFTDEMPNECRTDNNQTNYSMVCPIN